MAIVPSLPYADIPQFPDVPPLVLALLGEHLAPVLDWFTARVYGPMFARCADHPLVALKAWYDPAAVIAACAGFHHAPGTPGKPPDFTIEHFVRAEFVRTWAGTCSDRELEQLLSTDFLVRWFVGLPLTQRAPDHSTLADFHAYVSDHAPATFFLDVLRFLDQIDPEDPATTPQIVDTFAMASPVTPTRSVAYLLAQLSLRLIDIWQKAAPAAYQCAIPPLDLGPLTHFARLHTDADRQQRLHAIASVATWLGDGLTPHLSALEDAPRARAQTVLHAITKVIANELMTDSHGQWVERPTRQRGTHRIASAVDLEATFRKHEGSPAVLGSNAVISVTTTRIRSGVALTGSIPDGEAPIAALQQQREADLPLPPHMVMDQIGGWGKCRARTHAVSDGQTMMVARIPLSGGSDPSRFSVADFQVDAERRTCTCPAGVVSTKAYASGDGDGVHFRFTEPMCRGCADWDACRDPEAKPTGQRSVFISDYHPFQRAAASFNDSPLGRTLLGGRWQVEPVVAWLTRYQGCRRARRLGTAAAQFQLYQACAMRNLLMWLSRVRRGLAAPPVP